MLKGGCHCDAAHWTPHGDPGSDDGLQLHALPPLRRALGPMGTPAKADPPRERLFCPGCSCVLVRRGRQDELDGRYRLAVNVRMALPEAVADLPIHHSDGLATFEDPSARRPLRTRHVVLS
ncbi:hypothetical protein Sa4125_43300 [Aureimonas sp. SA4125]|nr:hypothetical protein Sa4125_43300 [Aureimonas sp. SA4125]